MNTGFRAGLLGTALVTSICLPAAAEDVDTRAEERFVVVASATDTAKIAGSAAYLTAEDLEKQAHSDINRVLRAVPGVNIQEEDGFGLRPNIGLRGTGLDRSSKITLMEDGVLVAPAPYAAPSAYYFPNIARMSGVEVVKGPSSIKYGPRTQGGSINFVSVPVPETTRAVLDLRGGDFNSVRGMATVGGNILETDGVSVDGVIQGLYEENTGFKDLDGGGDTGFRKEDYVAKITFRSGSDASVRQRLTIKGQYSDELSNETYLGLTDDDFQDNPFRRYRGSQRDAMDAEHSEISARYTAEFSNGLDVGLIVYRTDFARDWFKVERVNPLGTTVGSGSSGASISAILADPNANADAFEILLGEDGFVSADGAVLVRHNNRDYYAQGIQAVLGYEGDWLGVGHDVELGLRWHEDEVDRFQWFERFRMDNGTLVRTGVDTPGTESNRIETAEAIAIYVQDVITAGNWQITPGLRFETIDLERRDFGRRDPGRTGDALSTRQNTVNVLIPGLNVLYGVSETLSVFAGVHRGFEPPSPGNAGSDAEEAVNYEAGLRWLTHDSQIEVIGFFNDYSNIIGTCTASTGGGCDIGDQFDGGDVNVLGLEVVTATDLAQWLDTDISVPVTAAYTFTQAEFRRDFESSFDPWGEVRTGDRLPYIPLHQASASVGVEAGIWGGDLTMSWVGDVRTSAGQGAIREADLIGSRVVLDLAAYVEPVEQVRLTVSVRNLLDNEYAVARRPAGLRPGLPRMVLGGATLTF